MTLPRTAAHLRRLLRQSFPGVRFSARRKRGWRLAVSWSGGPSRIEVATVAAPLLADYTSPERRRARPVRHPRHWGRRARSGARLPPAHGNSMLTYAPLRGTLVINRKGDASARPVATDHATTRSRDAAHHRPPSGHSQPVHLRRNRRGRLLRPGRCAHPVRGLRRTSPDQLRGELRALLPHLSRRVPLLTPPGGRPRRGRPPRDPYSTPPERSSRVTSSPSASPTRSP
ncbi:LPD29 domain-containing protein [Streptomyces sp. B29(2018)]|uniref:LPD29 domain-containing protein n=1 Tax=Streptomyces sp. B29(2018) TaxID=2485016 RepID=UPI0013E2EDBB